MRENAETQLRPNTTQISATTKGRMIRSLAFDLRNNKNVNKAVLQTGGFFNSAKP